MVQILEKAKRLIAPDPEELWLRGGAEIRTTEIDPGRYENVPFFNLEIMKCGTKYAEPMLNELGHNIGNQITRTYVTSDGIDRATRLYLPDDKSEDYIVTMTTPWWTSIDGLNHTNAEAISRELGVAVALIGAEHSSRRFSFPLDGLRMSSTARRATAISLAKTAQSGQLIVADMCDEYGLPRVLVKTGESRGGMETDGEYPYASGYDLSIAYQDTTAKCLADQVFSEDSCTDELIQLPGSELVGAAYVTIEVIKKQATKRFLGTVSCNPNFIISSTIGVGPALASGETGRFTKWLPKYTAGHQVTFLNDRASRPNRQRELYIDYPNMALITLRGSHATLANPDTRRHLISRIGNFAGEYALCKGDVSQINWLNVHLKDDDSKRTMV